MSEMVTVNLPPEWLARLAERARREGVTVEQLVGRLLARSDDALAQLERRRLDELASRGHDTTLH